MVKILERGMPEVVGTYETGRDFGFVISDNPKFSKDIYIPTEGFPWNQKRRQGGCGNHQTTEAKNKNPEGKVIEGKPGKHAVAPGTDILAIVKSFGIPSEFPEKVMQAGRPCTGPCAGCRQRRAEWTLRHLQTVTIDGEDAKDLDDASYFDKRGMAFIIWVYTLQT